jgi:hypothetical protein
MINFLTPPSLFKPPRIASEGDQYRLSKIALYQFKYADTQAKRANWLGNVISSGLTKIENFFKHIADAVFGAFQKVIISTPVVTQATRIFQRLAYDRLLVSFYEAWKVGEGDFKSKRPQRDERDVKRIAKGVPYEVYLMGFEGRPSEDTIPLAENMARRSLGARTVSLILLEMVNLFNPIKTMHYLVKIKELWGSSRMDYVAMRALWSLPGIIFQSKMMISAFGMSFLSGLGLPVAVVGALAYYGVSDILIKDSKIFAKLIKTIHKQTRKSYSSHDLVKKIPPRDVYLQVAQGRYVNVLKAPKEEIEKAVAIGKQKG